MKRVFVSYSRNNREVVTQVIQDVQAVGIDTWHDQTLTGGQRWWDTILANIRESEIFVCALSPQYWESDACKSELAYAVQLGKAILPVLVADGVNLNLLTAPLNEIQVTDYRGCDKGAAFALIKCIHTAPGNPPLPIPLPSPPRVPVS
jgi:serine/threonine kinase PknH